LQNIESYGIFNKDLETNLLASYYPVNLKKSDIEPEKTSKTVENINFKKKYSENQLFLLKIKESHNSFLKKNQAYFNDSRQNRNTISLENSFNKRIG